ncbi:MULTISPECIES: FUSC family protein [unclassified Caballeronia]|uniref:FUSC family protein n=1 Tax=unclassified Caballeronia TaxID=2646786 RepID=UPI002862F0FF|nr:MULTISPECIES: FUSC family protein [unclassified Caballeronia]MDR5752457.1 FUSC family protein [Caballeronia sp. LZ024]MDR5845263.1 FUSC family protein [Caballeronia sp. LZ031]
MATIGAFTALYGSERPYSNRAWLLAGLALSFSAIVTLGVWVQQWPLMAVPLVTLIAMIATFVCQSLRIGPPGAYMFALACAAGTAVPVPVDRVFWLVLGGGAVSWVVHMFGALVALRGPEKSAVAAAADAVAYFAQATGIEARDRARHDAALALHDAWATLVSFQPPNPRADSTLTRLRALNRELHLIFATCVGTADLAAAKSDAMAKRARAIGIETTSLNEGQDQHADDADVPLGRLRSSRLLLENLTLQSPAFIVAGRVGVAVTLAGAAGAVVGLQRAYWAMAAAVLVLHMGQDWARTLQRGVERTIGTIVGLGVAGAILAAHPTDLWLVATIMSLQFLVEILVTRNYALAVVFVTAIALVIASGGQAGSDEGTLLVARGIDTTVGCAIGLLVYAFIGPRGSPASLRQQIARTLAAANAALVHVAAGKVTTDAALLARRDLQHCIFKLLRSYETDTAGGIARHRDAAERMWPAVVATQRLGYKILAACWSLEAVVDDPEAGLDPSAHLTSEELAVVNAVLADVIAAVRGESGSIRLDSLPELLQAELRDLFDSLVPDVSNHRDP